MPCGRLVQNFVGSRYLVPKPDLYPVHTEDLNSATFGFFFLSRKGVQCVHKCVHLTYLIT